MLGLRGLLGRYEGWLERQPLTERSLLSPGGS
jgi:hypothetical protein